MRPLGFSTGAVARGNFQLGLDCIRGHGLKVIELSALRLEELDPLVNSLDHLGLADFEYVSFHAPSRIPPDREHFVVEQLLAVADRQIPIVVHPDIIWTPKLWEPLRSFMLIENMDKRKPVGRTATEIRKVFEWFPQAGFCFDIGHARQVDPTMTEARLILEAFGGRLAQVRISEVNTSSRHDPLSIYAISAFRSVAALIPERIPVVLETLIDQCQSDITKEIDRARRALDATAILIAG